jgi:hypothetical protein
MLNTIIMLIIIRNVVVYFRLEIYVLISKGDLLININIS